MEYTRAFCFVIALMLAPVILNIITVTLAIELIEPESIVLFPGSDHKLNVNHKNKHSLGLHPESLELHFYKTCVDKNSNDCNKLLSDKRHHLNLFSETEKKECLNFDHKFHQVSNESRFCLSVTGNSSWSGGVINEKWPLNNLRNDETPFVTWAPTEKSKYDHSVVEYYFFNTQGYYLYFDEAVPLYVMGLKNPTYKICFIAKSDQLPFYKSNNTASMTFHICKYNNTREAHENAIRDVLGKPENLPNNYESIVEKPLWSTKTQNGRENVNISTVLSYALEIKNNYLFSLGTFEIDNLLGNCHYSTQFNEPKFGELTKIAQDLKINGLNVSLWITPFISKDCNVTNSDDYFVKNASNHREIKTWYDKIAYHVDFTNPEASYWWGNATRKFLDQMHINTLVFVGGESNWYPEHPNFHTKSPTYPDNINAYLETMKRVSDATQYKSLRKGQKFGNFLRLLDYKTEVNWYDALSMLVPSLINANMLGYPFVIPNMPHKYKDMKPSPIEYIRWVQAVTFMPAIQFSYLPRDYEDKYVNIIMKYMEIRKNYTNKIIDLMKKSVSNGSPLNPPIWWIAPTDSVAHSVNDEYLLGEDILVAPILVPGQTSRSIYFPAGSWRDKNYNMSAVYEGGNRYDYQAGEDILPWFIKENLTVS